MAHHAKSHNGVRPSPKAPLPIRKSSTNVDLRISQRVIDQQIVPAISRVSLFESRLSDRCARSDREAYRFLGTGTGHTLPTSPVSSENVEHATHAVDADYVHHGHAMAELRSPFTPSNNMEVNDEEFGFSSENISGDTILDNLMDPGHMDSNNC